MKIYDYNEVESCVICGNINGNFDSFFEKFFTQSKTHNSSKTLSKRKKSKKEPMNDKLIIINGCDRLGEKSLDFYLEKLEQFNKTLIDNNIHVLIVRGCDNPEYFENELINLSNIKTVKDYSIVKLKNYNCLCIGGYVSLDYQWRKEQEQRIKRKMFWEGESANYNEQELSNILEEYKIDCIITPNCPSFVSPSTDDYKKSAWCESDSSLFKILAKERIKMDKIYEKTIEMDKKPCLWVYSAFKRDNATSINGIYFKSLDKYQFFDVNKQLRNPSSMSSIWETIGAAKNFFGTTDGLEIRTAGAPVIEEDDVEATNDAPRIEPTAIRIEWPNYHEMIR